MAGRHLHRAARARARFRPYGRDPADPPAPKEKRCYVIQFRDGSFLRDAQGRIQFRYSQTAARGLYNNLLRGTSARTSYRGTQEYFTAKQRANFPQIVVATDCSETSVTPFAAKYYPAGVPRPHPPLSGTDETALKLLARARQSDAARQVAHDYLLEHYPEYRARIHEAGQASKRWQYAWSPITWESEPGPKTTIRHDQTVYISPLSLLDAFKMRWRDASKTRMQRMWKYAVVIQPLDNRYHWIRNDPRSWFPIFRVPAATPSQRDPRSRRRALFQRRRQRQRPLVLRDLAQSLRENPVREIDKLTRDLVIVDPTEADRCQRTVDQLERLASGMPLRREREGVRGRRPAPPISRRDLRQLHASIQRIAAGREPIQTASSIADAAEKYGLVTMTRSAYEECERQRLALKRALSKRRAAGQFVDAERGTPRSKLARGTQRCTDCTDPRFRNLRRCEQCHLREQERRRPYGVAHCLYCKNPSVENLKICEACRSRRNARARAHKRWRGTRRWQW